MSTNDSRDPQGSDASHAGRRVAFPLTRDAEGYPPADWEHLWAEPVGEMLFTLDSIPFFVRGVSVGDTVRAEWRDGMLVFRDVVDFAGHSTLRVVLFDMALRDALRHDLSGMGCETELSHSPALIAVDVPPSASLAALREFLASGEAAGSWEYEEGAVAQGR